MTTKDESKPVVAAAATNNPTAPVNELSIVGPTPATAPDDSLPLRDVPKGGDAAPPNPMLGNAVKCPHPKSECGFEAKLWENKPVWQCPRCGFDTMNSQIASIRRPDVVKV